MRFPSGRFGLFPRPMAPQFNVVFQLVATLCNQSLGQRIGQAGVIPAWISPVIVELRGLVN